MHSTERDCVPFPHVAEHGPKSDTNQKPGASSPQSVSAQGSLLCGFSMEAHLDAET